ncbi:hypothetical protein E2320_014422, partial [Naja naja]
CVHLCTKLGISEVGELTLQQRSCSRRNRLLSLHKKFPQCSQNHRRFSGIKRRNNSKLSPDGDDTAFLTRQCYNDTFLLLQCPSSESRMEHNGARRVLWHRSQDPPGCSL